MQGDDRIVRQVDKQLSKLVEIEQVTVLNDNEAVVREHLLIKLERSDMTSINWLQLQMYSMQIF